MNSEPPPIADPRSMSPQKAKVSARSARSLARSGFQLLIVGVTLFLCVAIFIPTNLPIGVYGGFYNLGHVVAFSCCIIGLMRLVEAGFKSVPPRPRQSEPR